MIIVDIERTLGDEQPAEEWTFGADLTGHAAHLVVATDAGVTVDAIPGTLVCTPSSSVATFAVTAAVVATAGRFEYSIIIDMETESLRETKVTGDWIVTDYPG